MRLAIITETVQDQLAKLATAHNINTDTIVDLCVEISKKYWKWVLNQLSLQNFDISLDLKIDGSYGYVIYMYTGFDSPRFANKQISDVLLKFEKIAPKLPSQFRDISYYPDLKSINDVIAKYTAAEDKLVDKHGIVVYKDDTYKISKITDPNDLRIVGKNTGWCTRADAPDCKSEHYIEDYGHIYILYRYNRPYIQFTPDFREVQDVQRLSAIQELLQIFKNMKIDNFVASNGEPVDEDFIFDMTFPDPVSSGIVPSIIRKSIANNDRSSDLFSHLLTIMFDGLKHDFDNYVDDVNFERLEHFVKYYGLDKSNPEILKDAKRKYYEF